MNAIETSKFLENGGQPFPARQALIAIQMALDITPADKWAETWVNLRMEFFRRYQGGRIFPNFGIDFFEVVASHLESQKRYISQGDCNGYDANFNAWVFLTP